MKIWHPLIVLVLTINFGHAVEAQTTRKAAVIYVPKVQGQTKQRTDGATRGGMDASNPPPVVRVVTPEEIGLVASDRPTLYWSIEKPTAYRCDVVVKTLDDEPVFEQHLDGVKAAGLMSIDMTKGGKKLEPGRDYRFAVLITLEPNEPASDIESSGTIRYEPPSADAAKQAAGTPTERAAALAANSYFIDAVAALAKDASADSEQALADLLAQVKLKIVVTK